jgi:polar amino acid transport system substrate-binding protein
LPAAEDLQGIQSEGTLRVATTLDNPPFSTYDQNLKPTGLDIELITDLGRRLGLRVEIDDFTFDKLANAVVNDLADVAIAAISITPERASQVDFTNVYYVGQDAVLAALDSDIAKVASLDDLAALRVGAQEGSVYESWLRENAVETGKMPAEKLVALVSPDSGIDALEADEIDVMLLDRLPARALAEQGKAKLVGEAIYPQVYGIAVRKGSSLLPELNRVLAEAQADGTMKRLVEKYLKVAPEEVLPATPAAGPTP